MTLLFVLLIFAALAIGLPVALGIGLVSGWWIVFINGFGMVTLAQRVYYSIDSFPLVALPLFVIIGFLAERTGALPDMVRWLQMLLGNLRGGMAYINILASMLLAGISGTATADVASLGRLEIQMMRHAGYSLPYSASLTAASAMLGPIIPPSVVMIIYALSVGNISIAGLFLAGLVPGFLLAAGMMVMSWVKARGEKHVQLVERPSPSQLFRQTLRVIPILILPVIIVGGATSGVFTVTESAAVGVIYVLVIGMFGERRLKLSDIQEAMVYSAKISSVAGLLLASGALLSYIFSINMITNQVADYVGSVSAGPIVFLLLTGAIVLVVGMFMDALPIIVALAPLLAPIAHKYNIPDYQFAMVFLMSALVGLVTPPVGMVLFITSSIGKVSVERLSVAILPFVLWMILVVVIVAVLPQVTVFIPSLAHL